MKKLALSALNDLFAAINAAEALYIPADDAAGQGAKGQGRRYAACLALDAL